MWNLFSSLKTDLQPCRKGHIVPEELQLHSWGQVGRQRPEKRACGHLPCLIRDTSKTFHLGQAIPKHTRAHSNCRQLRGYFMSGFLSPQEMSFLGWFVLCRQPRLSPEEHHRFFSSLPATLQECAEPPPSWYSHKLPCHHLKLLSLPSSPLHSSFPLLTKLQGISCLHNKQNVPLMLTYRKQRPVFQREDWRK